MNKCNPALIARHDEPNRFKNGAKNATGNADIPKRRWLLLDIDVPRPTGISATIAEKKAAKAVAKKVGKWLVSQQGFPEPVVADSGNGVHLLFRIDLANTESHTRLVKSVLVALADKFDTAG